MAAQHTPGPWVLDEDDFSVMATVGAHIATVTDVHQLPCVDTDDEDRVQDECLANARLIAAAPDLLAALRTFVQDGHNIPFADAIENGLAAIAKATEA